MQEVTESWLLAAGASQQFFRALADPTRRRLLEHIVAGPAAPSELARRLALPRVNVSHHLSVLASAGLVTQRQRQAVAVPDALTVMRRYFDAALATASITGPVAFAAVAPTAHSKT